MKTLLLELVDYHHHYNELFIAHCRSNKDKITDRTLELLNHSIAAQVIWNKRLLGDSTFDPGLWTNRALDKMQEWENEHSEITKKIIIDSDLSEVIKYSNSKAEVFENTIGDIIFHALNHYSYHRGQITLEFRKVGIEAIPSDYILYKR